MMIVQVSLADWLSASVMQAWRIHSALIWDAGERVSFLLKAIDTDFSPSLCDTTHHAVHPHYQPQLHRINDQVP